MRRCFKCRDFKEFLLKPESEFQNLAKKFQGVPKAKCRLNFKELECTACINRLGGLHQKCRHLREGKIETGSLLGTKLEKENSEPHFPQYDEPLVVPN